MAEGKVDPVHQFTIQTLFGTENWAIGGYNIAFTNSALWMAITAVLVWVFVAGGMKRQLVPGRWQMAVEGLTGFVDDLLTANIGKAGRKAVQPRGRQIVLHRLKLCRRAHRGRRFAGDSAQRAGTDDAADWSDLAVTRHKSLHPVPSEK